MAFDVPMGYGVQIPANQLGGFTFLWGMRGYGLSTLWVMRGLTLGVRRRLPAVHGYGRIAHW
ncbi:hypothetical protein EDB86DRAFT_2941111 [Lactarius hatsudake]|nr:hypothetical protein EDB86DRAFT_2941111 [Lactarius hatsudake]